MQVSTPDFAGYDRSQPLDVFRGRFEGFDRARDVLAPRSRALRRRNSVLSSFACNVFSTGRKLRSHDQSKTNPTRTELPLAALARQTAQSLWDCTRILIGWPRPRPYRSARKQVFSASPTSTLHRKGCRVPDQGSRRVACLLRLSGWALEASANDQPIESSFAMVRHRTVRSKGCLSNKTALAMIFKLAEAAEKSWRRLDGHNQLPKIILGVRFTDGIEVVKPQAQAA
jgi:hypothetical protein